MKSINCLKISLGALLVGGLFGRPGEACDNVFVRSLNGASSTVNIGLTMNSTPADSLGFSLGASGSKIDALAVGPNSPNLLNLGAQVTMGSLQATCSTSVTNDNVTGQCSGIVDPKYDLMIDLIPGTPGSTGSHNGKGNGNAWGTYKHCFKTMAEWKAFKSNPANRKMGTSDGWCPGSAATPDQLTCQFVLVPSF